MTKPMRQDDPAISIAQLKQGDAHAFAQFITAYQDMVFACCRALGLSKHDVEDAASETFLAAWQSIGKFNEKSKLSSWLWSIAYHKAIDCRRQKHPCAVSDDSGPSIAPSHENISDSLENGEQSDRVWQAVRNLTTSQAAVIVLYYREEKSIEEIAAILTMPQNTVKTHLHRGRKELYLQLRSVWESDHVRR